MLCKGSNRPNPRIDARLMAPDDRAWPCVACTETVLYKQSVTGTWVAESHEETARLGRPQRRRKTKGSGSRSGTGR
jgi:hypothetical protein